MSLEPLVNNENLFISRRQRNSPSTTLCFTGIGHAIGGVDIQSEEFVRATSDSDTFFIIDKQRTWGNNIDWDLLKEVVNAGSQNRFSAIGNSMGGFLAILSSCLFRVEIVVAFVPQFSVDKRVVDERRFDEYVDKIDNFVYSSLSNCFKKETEYYCFFGVGGDDDKQLNLFPQSENLHKILFPESRFCHSVAQVLKDHGVLYEVISDCFNPIPPQYIIDKHLRRICDSVYLGR